MSASTPSRMNSVEIRSGVSLSTIFALRILGLFLILPVFAVAARDLPGGDNVALVGFALGAYGITQAIFHIPFGFAADRFGRKPVIVFGLLLFALGSFIAAYADNLYWICVGRVLQGAGAISPAVTALAADLTREEHRTKIMAMIGSSIGLVFALSLVIAPPLFDAGGLWALFMLTGVLSLAAIALLFFAVPKAPPPVDAGRRARLSEVVFHPQLARLHFGIFALHVLQVGMFMLIPGALVAAGDLPLAEHWKLYLPAVVASFIVMIPAIIIAEKHLKFRAVFVASVALLLLTELGFIYGRGSFVAIAALVFVFFVAFNVLEALLPSLVTRFAGPEARGLALGVYNTAQAVGLFVGGALGGWLARNAGADAVFWFGAGVCLVWILISASMIAPPLRKARSTPPAPDAQTQGA
ncbi:MFS transporter [Rhodocyclus purpureus]|uniref:MFS transporter n=1 Tax=Rhodocyclus purpureus TaxID=1067 RepID=UPI001F5D2F1D|nr:MFS transporter [Rhodocyclus purpureus]